MLGLYTFFPFLALLIIVWLKFFPLGYSPRSAANSEHVTHVFIIQTICSVDLKLSQKRHISSDFLNIIMFQIPSRFFFVICVFIFLIGELTSKLLDSLTLLWYNRELQPLLQRRSWSGGLPCYYWNWRLEKLFVRNLITSLLQAGILECVCGVGCQKDFPFSSKKDCEASIKGKTGLRR